MASSNAQTQTQPYQTVATLIINSGHSSTPLIGSHRIHPCPGFSIDDTKSLSIDLEDEAPQAHVQGALFQSFSNALSQLGVVVFAASVSVAGEYSGNTAVQARTETSRSCERSICYKMLSFATRRGGVQRAPRKYMKVESMTKEMDGAVPNRRSVIGYGDVPVDSKTFTKSSGQLIKALLM